MTWLLQNRQFLTKLLSPYVFLQPPTEKTHQIIARTAKFVSEHGGQSEIVLRVKQGSNPVFGFLMPDHHLHVYFRFLVDHPEVFDADNKADRKHVEKDSVQGEGLSLLGSVYGTGDDEDEGTTQVSVDSKEGGSSIQDCSVDNTACSTDSGMALEKAESLIRKDLEEDICSTKQHTALKHDASNIDQPSVLEGSRHPSGDSLGTHASPSHELARNGTQSVQTSGNQVHQESAPISEPPSFLKRVVEKMVEFIARNGKEFEGIIVNQDRVNGQFPFLLPTNQYHPYYLKVLEAAQQGKLHEKGSGSEKTSPTDVRPSEIRKSSQPKKMNNSAGDESLLVPRGSSSEDINPIHAKKTLDLDKKTKFKIVLGGSKKDGCDHGSGKPLGMTSEAAASAVRAATKMPANFRGLSQVIAEVKDGNKKEGGMSTDAAAAIVMAATRGSRRPQQGATSEAGTLRGGILQKILKGMSEESDGIGSAGASPGRDGDASHLNSSSGGMPFLQAGQNSGVSGSSSKFVVDGGLPCQQSGDISGASGSILRLVDQNMPKDDASVAKVMVKAAALAAAREADSSEACLSREEKLKAERLKRAKVFAALIKNEQHVSESENVQSTPEGAVSLHESGSKATICGSSYNASSVPLGSSKGRISDVSARGEDCGQTEVLAASEDCNNKPSTKYLERDRQSHRHRHRHHGDHHKRSKSQHDKSDDDCAADDESRRRRHKHDTDKNHKHSSSDRHSRKRHYESSSLRSSEDGHKRSRHRSISRERDTGKRRDRYDSKEDGHRHRSKDNSSQKHTKKSYSEKEKSSKDNIKEKPTANSLKDVEVSAPEVSHSLSPSHASEVPDDLRAKVRAMLLANL